VTALARGLDVLRCFGPTDPWLTNQEIARRTGLARPTVTRLAYTLARLGYLRPSGALGKYALGPASHALGFAALAQLDLRRVARPLLQSLAEQTPTAVHLAVRDGLEMVLVDTYRTSAAFLVDIGSRVPLATTSLGRAWLCAIPDPARRRILEQLRRAEPAGWPQLRKGIDTARAQFQAHGYCLGLGDWRREVHAVGVPLALPDGGEPVAFGCSGAAFQLPGEFLRRELGPRLVAVVGNVRAALAQR
jgi:DNA-binding IclR family transcriptional regulator